MYVHISTSTAPLAERCIDKRKSGVNEKWRCISIEIGIHIVIDLFVVVCFEHTPQ